MASKSFPELKFSRQMGRVLFSPKRPYSICFSRNELYILCRALNSLLFSTHSEIFDDLIENLILDLDRLYRFDK